MPKAFAATASIEQWAAWWLEWPLSRWMDEQNGRRWFKEQRGMFTAAINCPAEHRADFESLTSELIDYRLAQYTSSRLLKSSIQAPESFVAKVTHSGGRPILMLPTVEEVPGRPVGPVEMKLPDGSTWIFRFVQIACNVAAPKGATGNNLGELLRNWFGPDAGLPGTGFKVTFQHSVQGWSVTPATLPSAAKAGNPVFVSDPLEPRALELIPSPPQSEQYTRFVPVYTLEAAAGLWSPETEPEEAGWTEVSRFKPRPGMFVITIRGRSMEPKIPDGSWCLFRKCPPGSREGKIVVVQFNTMGDPETGGRYTVKRYHSEKTVTEDSWTHHRIQLLPLNPDYQPIEVESEEAEQMLVIGELVGVL